MDERVRNVRTWQSAGTYIDRRSPWGNPFGLRYYSRVRVIAMHWEWLMDWHERGLQDVKGKFDNKWVCEHIQQLEGKTLLCWCHPKPCHGDNLIKLLGMIRKSST